jgi:pyrophosphatase PpaX
MRQPRRRTSRRSLKPLEWTARPLATLFDLDGTLIDSIELILDSARHAFAERTEGVPDDAEWLTGVGIPLATMFRRYARDEADVDALIARYREYQLEHHDRLTRCYDQVVETVDFLRAAGHPCAIVTSKTEWLARRGLDHVGLARHFDVIVGCDSCQRHKPDPEPVLLALDRLGYQPQDAVFVGDSVHDMLAGNAAGVTTIAALWGPFGREDLAAARPAHYLERIADLPRLLATIQASKPGLRAVV